MKISVILIFTLLSTNSFASKNEAYGIELFCQDMNVVLQRVQTLAFNIANHKTTRTVEGGYFKRRLITNCKQGQCTVKEDNTSPILKYEPNHPDANEQGYVAYPNFSLAEEKAKLIKAQNAYDLIVGNMPTNAKSLLVGNDYEQCFTNYKFFREQFDFKKYLGRN